MPVFDFKNEPVSKEDAVCTYVTFESRNEMPDADHPLMVLDHSEKEPFHRILYQSE